MAHVLHPYRWSLRRSRGTMAAAVVTLALACSVASSSHAQPSPADKAAAEVLFEEGRRLIAAGKYDEAAPWLEKAIASKRYDSYHYPWYNLGRAYLAKELLNKARECFEKSLEIAPGYTLARDALRKVRSLVQ